MTVYEVKTYSDPAYIFSGGPRLPQTPRIYASAPLSLADVPHPPKRTTMLSCGNTRV